MNQTTLDTLTKAGMDEKSAEMYLILAENGESTVPQILEHTALSRATVYEVLPLLLAEDFIEYRKDGRVAYYRAVHPTKLLELLDQKKRQLTLLEEEMNETVRQVVGSFQLANNKQGVRFFEGEEGLKEALWDSLGATETIYTFINNKTVASYGKELDHLYVEERIKKGIKKKIIMIDNHEAKARAEELNLQFTEVKFIDEYEYPFEGASEIYDETVSHLMIHDGVITAMLIKNPQIARQQKMLFEFLWDKL